MSLSIAPQSARVEVGGEVTLWLSLRNAGDVSQRYDVDVTGVPAEWLSVDKPRGVLLPHSTALVQVRLRPPRDVGREAIGNRILSVQLRGGARRILLASAAAALAVVTGGWLDMDVQPRAVRGEEGLFSVSFLNQSDTPAEVTLVARPDRDGLRYSVEPDRPLVVPAGGVTGPVLVRVAPTVRETVGEPRGYGIELRGHLSGQTHDPHLEPVVQARFTYLPPYEARWLPARLRRAPTWALLLPPIVLSLLLMDRVLAAFDTPPPPAAVPTPIQVVPGAVPTVPDVPARARLSTAIPSRGSAITSIAVRFVSIQRLSILHDAHARPYALVWRTGNASAVTLDGRAVAVAGRQALRGPVDHHVFRLLVTNGVGRELVQALAELPVASHRSLSALVMRRDERYRTRDRAATRTIVWQTQGASRVWIQGTSVPASGGRALHGRMLAERVTVSG